MNLTVADVMSECPQPQELLRHAGIHLGIRSSDRSGISRYSQIEALLPYLDQLDEMTIAGLWDVCNSHGWLSLRKEHFDQRLNVGRNQWKFVSDRRAQEELDKLLLEQGPVWADLWIESFLKTGVSIDHVAQVVGSWLDQNESTAGLALAASIVSHVGNRRHLSVLQGREISPLDEAESEIANASFAVMRRSLA